MQLNMNNIFGILPWTASLGTQSIVDRKKKKLIVWTNNRPLLNQDSQYFSGQPTALDTNLILSHYKQTCELVDSLWKSKQLEEEYRRDDNKMLLYKKGEKYSRG